MLQLGPQSKTLSRQLDTDFAFVVLTPRAPNLILYPHPLLLSQEGSCDQWNSNVAEFNIEATGDVTDGDTILFTERVFEAVSGNGRKKRHPVSGLSTQSVASFSAHEQKNEFIGERTIAARVLRTREPSKGRLGRAEPVRSSF